MRNPTALLVAGSLGLWLVIAYPVRMCWGDAAIAYSGVALLLCLVPTAVTLLWCQRALAASPEQQLVAVMGGTVVRMAFVLAAGMAVYHGFAYFHRQSFWLWVIVFYLITLTLEMSLVLRRQPPTDRSTPSQS